MFHMEISLSYQHLLLKLNRTFSELLISQICKLNVQMSEIKYNALQNTF